MNPRVNPYDAPGTQPHGGKALPASIAPALRAALAVIALDFGRGVVWRLSSASGVYGTDSFNPNVATQLVFAVALVFAITFLTKRREGLVVAPPLRLAAIASSIASVSMYATRLLVDAAAGVTAQPSLELATVTLDAVTIVLASLYFAAMLGEIGAADDRRFVQRLVAFYAALTAAALVVVASVVLRRHAFLPPLAGNGIRAFATLGFIGLGFGSYVYVQRLVRRVRA